MNYLTTLIKHFEMIKKKILDGKMMEGFEDGEEEEELRFITRGYSKRKIKNAANNNDRTRTSGLSIMQIEDLLDNLDESDEESWKAERKVLRDKKRDGDLSDDEYLKKITPIIEKYFVIVIARFPDFFDDRIKTACDDDYTDYAGNCWKDIKTIKIFLMMPIANCIVIAVLTFLYAGFLFKIKSSPLALSKDGLRCSSIPLGLIFKKDPLEGIVKEEVYTSKAKKHKFEKILFPWLAKSIYPVKPKLINKKNSEGESVQKFGMGYLLMLPLFLSLKYCTTIWYTPLSAVKKMLYKNKQWGVGQELKKINKEWWLKDFLTIFIVVPILLFLVFPILFILTMLIPAIVSPLVAWGLYILPNKKNMIFDPVNTDDDDDGISGKIKTFLLKAMQIFKMISWLLGYIMLGMFWSIIIIGMAFMWFLQIFTGAHEGKRDGLKTILATWANIVWDYKFIWAIMAIVIWIFNFKIYLKGPHSSWEPMSTAAKHSDMTTGIIGGITIILLAMKQMQFFKFLPKTPKYRKDCHPNCNPPSRTPEEMGLTKKCPPKSSSVKV
jgi:hypothetical protein